jgi:hypothetical protein
MKVMDLITFIRSQVDFSYFPNRFPIEYAPDHCAAVTVYPGKGIDEWTQKKEPSFQILVRGEKHGDAEAESKAHEIFNALQNYRDAEIGGESAVIIRPKGSSPFYIGSDDNGRPIYSMNFDAVIRAATQL